MYVTSMSDLTGLLTYVSSSVMPWYITMPVPTITPSVQRRLQKIDSADAILPTPWADVSSANARSKALKDCLFLAIAGSGVAAFDFISASIFQVSMEDDLEASSVLKKKNQTNKKVFTFTFAHKQWRFRSCSLNNEMEYFHPQNQTQNSHCTV